MIDRICCTAIALALAAAGAASAQQNSASPIIRPNGTVSLEERGYGTARQVYSSDRLSFYITPFSSEGGGKNYLIVHHGGWTDDVITQTANASGVYEMTPDLQAEVTEAVETSGMFVAEGRQAERAGVPLFNSGSRRQLRHFFEHYATGEFDTYGRENPAFSTTVANISEQRYRGGAARLTLELGFNTANRRYQPFPANGAQTCIAGHVEARMDVSEARRVCQFAPASDEPSVFAAVGLLSPEFVRRDGVVAIYRAQLPSLDQALVLVHDVDPDAPLIELEPGSQPQRMKFADSYVQRMWDFGAEAGLPQDSSLDVIHLVNSIDYAAYEKATLGLSNAAIMIRVQNRNYAGVFNMREMDALNLPAVTANQGVAQASAHADAQQLGQVASTNEKSPAERDAIRAQLASEAAERYGHVVRPAAYWERFSASHQSRGGAPLPNPTARRIFDGDFTRARPISIALPLMRYVENMNDQCPSALPENAVPIEIITTQTTYDARSYADISSREVGRRTVHIAPALASLYARYFDNAEGRIDQMGRRATAEAIQDLFTGRNRAADKTAAAFESMWSVNWMFAEEACGGPALTQLGENLRRAGLGLPSLQAEGLDYAGRRTASPETGTRPRLLWQELDGGSPRVVFTYGDTPPGWLPPVPRELLAMARAAYGETNWSSYRQANAPTIATVVVEAPNGDGLAEMRITTPGATLFIHQMQDRLWEDRSEFFRELRRMRPTPDIVECEYANGGYLSFWRTETPSVVRTTDQSASPLAIVGPPRAHCPATYDGPPLH